jgi:hypothetical protein
MIRPCTLVIARAEKAVGYALAGQPCLVTHSRTHLPAVSVKGQTLPRGPDAASGRCGNAREPAG